MLAIYSFRQTNCSVRNGSIIKLLIREQTNTELIHWIDDVWIVGDSQL